MDNTSCRFAGTFTGATGLEPATSGVTGRHGPTGYNRLRPRITGYSRHSSPTEPVLTGYDRLAPGTARVAGVWPTRCRMRQQTSFSGGGRPRSFSPQRCQRAAVVPRSSTVRCAVPTRVLPAAASAPGYNCSMPCPKPIVKLAAASRDPGTDATWHSAWPAAVGADDLGVAASEPDGFSS